MTRCTAALAAWLAASCFVLPAIAEPQSESAVAAQKLFDEALALMKAGRYAEACPRLQQSQKLDPGMGTQFRLGECYESAGLVGSAWQIFGEVAEEAKKAGRADREAQVRQRVAALQARVPWMTLNVPAAVLSLPGLNIKRDGELVDRADYARKVAVDPGAHTLTVAATGKRPWQQSVRALEGGSLEVAIPPLEDEGSPSAAAPIGGVGSQQPAATGLGGQRVAAIVAASVGVAGLATGAVVGLMAKSKWDTALAGCANGETTACSSKAVSDGSSADTLAAVSTTGFVVGGAALATGVVLWLTAPKRGAAAATTTGFEITPAIGPRQAAFGISGRFQ